MQTIKFNKHIDRVGIEFEGFFTPELVNRIGNHNLFMESCDDGSLEFQNISSDDYEVMEIPTTPLKESALNKVLEFMNIVFNDEEYKINKTCGLHYHISFDDKAYGALCTPEFYREYAQMIKRNFPKIYMSRKNNRYCLEDVSSTRHSTISLPQEYYTYIRTGRSPRRQLNVNDNSDGHFKRQSDDKYHFINYQIDAFKTLEFRVYGGEYANIEGLASCIQCTIDLVDRFVSSFVHEKDIEIKAGKNELRKKLYVFEKKKIDFDLQEILKTNKYVNFWSDSVSTMELDRLRQYSGTWTTCTSTSALDTAPSPTTATATEASLTLNNLRRATRRLNEGAAGASGRLEDLDIEI